MVKDSRRGIIILVTLLVGYLIGGSSQPLSSVKSMPVTASQPTINAPPDFSISAELASGIYKATDKFLDDSINPWVSYSTGTGTASVVSNLGGFAKVLKMYDPTIGSGPDNHIANVTRAMSATTTGTIELWIRPTTYSGDFVIEFQDANSRIGPYVRCVGPSGGYLVAWGNGVESAHLPYTPNTNYHVRVAFDSGADTQSVWVNGQLLASGLSYYNTGVGAITTVMMSTLNVEVNTFYMAYFGVVGQDGYQLRDNFPCINWTISDDYTNAPTFDVYSNGTPYFVDQPWISGVPNYIPLNTPQPDINNYTIIATDGMGASINDTIVIRVDTNGIWQDILVGMHTLQCKTAPDLYAEFLIQGVITGARIKITAQLENPTSTALSEAMQYFSITLQGISAVKLPVTSKFYYNQTLVPAGIKESDLSVYHFENGKWVELPGILDTSLNCILVSVESFSEFAIAQGSRANQPPIDPVVLGIIAAIIAAIAMIMTWFLKQRGKKSSGPEETFPELDFDDFG